MPAAIPVVASIAASAAIPAGFAVFGLSTTVTAALITGAAGLAGSVVAGTLAPRPQAPDLTALLNNAGAGRTQQVRQPIAPHQIPCGRIKVSGPILFVHTADDDNGTANGYLYLIHGLSGVHVGSIGAVFLGDDLSTDAKFSGLVRVTPHLGSTTQVADADLVAEIPTAWTADHRLRGRAYIATRLKWSPEAYPSGIPNIAVICDGHDEIFDPRVPATRFTNNVALCIARWFTAPFGMGLDWADLDEPSVIAAANVCDERVRVKLGSTTATAASDTDILTLADGARVFDWGDGVRFTTTGTLPGGLAEDTTYYVKPQSDKTMKVVGTLDEIFTDASINLTTNGSGTTTVIYWDEARYKIGGQFTTDAPKGDVLNQLKSAMAGEVVYLGGKWFIHAGAAAAPTITLTENDLRGDLTWIPKRSMRDRFNGVRAVYVNPDAKWQPVDAPPLQSETYLAEDDGEELYEDIRLPFTRSTRGVQRLQKIAMERNRQQGICMFPAKLTAMRLQPWDGVFVNNTRYRWQQKQFRVIGWALAEDGGVDLTLQEDNASVYAWTSAEEQDSAIQQGVVLPDPSAIAAPAEIMVTTPDTISYDRLQATWSEVKNIFLDGYDVEYRDDGVVAWTGYGRVGRQVSREVSVERTSPQDFRVRAVANNTAASAFVENLAPSAPTSVLATPGTGEIALTWTAGAGASQTQIFHSLTSSSSTATLLTTESDTSHTHTGLGASEQHFYWLRSLNSGGNISDVVAVNATTD